MAKDNIVIDTIALLNPPQMLIATNCLNASAFEKQVILLHEHNSQGSKGLIINQPLETELGKVLEQLDIESNKPDINNKEIYLGGPVERSQGVIVSFENQQMISDIQVKSQKNQLVDVINEKKSDEFLVALGHTAWAAGQLEQELSKGYWIVRDVDPGLIFKTPVQDRWLEASSSLGFDMRTMSNFIGHG